MLVFKSKYVDLQRALTLETGRRKAAESEVARQAATIRRLQSRLTHQQDEHPDTPVSVQPATGHARLVQQLELSERARKQLDEMCLGLHWTTVQQDRELIQLRDQVAALQAAAETREVAS